MRYQFFVLLLTSGRLLAVALHAPGLTTSLPLSWTLFRTFCHSTLFYSILSFLMLSVHFILAGLMPRFSQVNEGHRPPAAKGGFGTQNLKGLSAVVECARLITTSRRRKRTSLHDCANKRKVQTTSTSGASSATGTSGQQAQDSAPLPAVAPNANVDMPTTIKCALDVSELWQFVRKRVLRQARQQDAPEPGEFVLAEKLFLQRVHDIMKNRCEALKQASRAGPYAEAAPGHYTTPCCSWCALARHSMPNREEQRELLGEPLLPFHPEMCRDERHWFVGEQDFELGLEALRDFLGYVSCPEGLLILGPFRDGVAQSQEVLGRPEWFRRSQPAPDEDRRRHVFHLKRCTIVPAGPGAVYQLYLLKRERGTLPNLPL